MQHFLSSLSSRSLGMTLGNTSWLKQMYIDALKDGSSVVAVDKEGKLMGVRVGKVTRCSRDGRPSLYVSVFSSSQESRLGSLVWGQNDSGCRQSDISLAKGGWIQCRLSKMVANKLLSVLSWLIFMKSCFFQKLKILMNFMGPAWLDFKPYKILSELPCEVLEKILSTSLFVSNLFNIVMFIVQWQDKRAHRHNQYWGDVRRQGGLLSKVARSEGTWHRACQVIQLEDHEDLANNALMSEVQTLNTLRGRDICTGFDFWISKKQD